MEKHIVEKYNNKILDKAMECYGILPEQIKLLDGFESFIYEFQMGDAEFILRISHSSRRTANMINGEVDFINYLADNGVGVSRAIHSMNQKLVEEIHDEHGGFFLVTAFVKAEGATYTKAIWKAPLWQEYGRQLGRMNRLALDYKVSNPDWTRMKWGDEDGLEMEKWIPKDEPKVLAECHKLTAYLQTLPTDISVYGMIHQDAHGGNMFVDEAGKITFFDFDDCCFGWYAYDLAMVLFYAIPFKGDTIKLASEFLPEFLKGYREEFEIDEYWLSQIPHFLKLREIDLYAVIHRSFDVDNLEDDPWVKNFMDGRREKIEKGIPFLEMDFTQFKL